MNNIAKGLVKDLLPPWAPITPVHFFGLTLRMWIHGARILAPNSCQADVNKTDTSNLASSLASGCYMERR